MTACTTHHHAFDCREQKFAERQYCGITAPCPVRRAHWRCGEPTYRGKPCPYLSERPKGIELPNTEGNCER